MYIGWLAVNIARAMVIIPIIKTKIDVKLVIESILASNPDIPNTIIINPTR